MLSKAIGGMKLIVLAGLLVLAQASPPAGYYAGVTAEGYAVGFCTNNPLNGQDAYRATFKIHDANGKYYGLKTVFEKEPNRIYVYGTYDSISNSVLNVEWRYLQGQINYSGSLIQDVKGCFSWQSSLQYPRPSNYRASNYGIHWTCSYIGTTIPGPSPTNLSVSITLPKTINLTWTPAVGAWRYWVYWATSQAGPYYVLRAKTTPSDVISTMTPGTTYWFKVAAENAWGTTDQSAPVSVTIPR